MRLDHAAPQNLICMDTLNACLRKRTALLKFFQDCDNLISNMYTRESWHTFVAGLGLEQLAKVGRHGDRHGAGAKDVGDDDGGVLVGARVAAQHPGVEHGVHRALGPLPHQVPQAVAQLGDVLADALLRVVHPPVHVGQLVVRLRSTPLHSAVQQREPYAHNCAPQLLAAMMIVGCANLRLSSCDRAACCSAARR